MKRIMLSNAFSLNMLSSGFSGRVEIKEVNPIHFLDQFYLAGINPVNFLENCVGHADTDYLVREHFALNGITIPRGERKTVSLCEDDILLVAQYSGPRLPEGTTRLPEGAKFTWSTVQIVL